MPRQAAIPLADIVAAALAEAAAHTASGRYLEAEQLLRDALKADPRCHSAMHMLAQLALQFRKIDVAEKLAADALGLNARDAAYHTTMGRVRRAQERHAEAEASLRTALRHEPKRVHVHADAQVLLGLTLKAQGRLDEAVACYRKALRLRPDFPEATLNLANALRERGDADASAALYRQAAAAGPQLAEAQSALAASLLTQGRKDEALEQYRRALALKPEQPSLQYLTGWLTDNQGDTAAAIAAYRRAVEQKPDYADAWVNLGLALSAVGQAQESLDCFIQAIRVDPEHVEAHVNFAVGLGDFGLTAESLAIMRRAAELRPDSAAVLSNRGTALIQNSKQEEAIPYLRRAVELESDAAPPLANLGMALRGPGVQGESIAVLRRAVTLDPDNDYLHSNLLLSLCYAGGIGANEIVEAAREFGSRPFARAGETRFRDPQARIAPDPSRRLRIGYVSPDFRTHSVAYFVEPVLARHDRSRFEVFCYYLYAREDDTTLRLKAHADHWRSSFAIPAAALARQVREDAIDVLVDLSGHTAHHRLLAFAHKPAPLQMTWLGYPSTVGLPAIDYRISDQEVDPPGYERFNSECVLRLPGSYFCYRPGPAPAVGPLPASAEGRITFGSFNVLSKLSDATVALWARVLREQPHSRLLIKSRMLGEERARERVNRAFAAAGVDSERLELLAWADTAESHLELYNRIDIALDTYPYNGATTSCEALWMGVPVVSLSGETHASRMGRSILGAAGLAKLVAETEDDFAAIAARLAANREQLAKLRAGMRERLRASPLLAEAEFTRDLESLYRAAWSRWCADAAPA